MPDPDPPTYRPTMTASPASHDPVAARSTTAGNSTTAPTTANPAGNSTTAPGNTPRSAFPTELPTNTPTNPPNSTAPIFIAHYTPNPNRRTFFAIDPSAFPPLTIEDFAPPPTPMEQIAALRRQVAALEARIAETPEQQVKRLMDKTEDKKITLVEVITELDRRRAVAVEELVEAEKELAALKAWMQARERTA